MGRLYRNAPSIAGRLCRNVLNVMGRLRRDALNVHMWASLIKILVPLILIRYFIHLVLLTAIPLTLRKK